MRRLGVGCLLVWAGVVAPAYAQSTVRVSVSSDGAQGTSLSSRPSISADGRYVAFESFAPNLVPGDTNLVPDIFVRDRQTGTTERVSLGANGVQANGLSSNPSISADGRFVAFESNASNLVPGDTNGAQDIFVRDRQTGTTTRVSVVTGGAEVAGASYDPTISANGRYVLIRSAAKLVPDKTGGAVDVYWHDREQVVTLRVNVTPKGFQSNNYALIASISADGRYVAFDSPATNIVANDTNDHSDVFVRDMFVGATTRVSVATNGAQADGENTVPGISGDGRYVAFTSYSGNLEPGGRHGLYIHDRQTHLTSPLTVIAKTADDMFVPGLVRFSGDGRSACYGQRNLAGVYEQLLIDRQSFAITKLTVGFNGEAVNNTSTWCAPNSDGTIIGFESSASNLVAGDSNGTTDVFVRLLPSTMALDKTTLAFAAVTNGTTFTSQTATQIVRLTQDGSVPVTWTAASTQPWLKVSPASGAGSGVLSISVTPSAGLPASGTVTGTIAVALTGAANSVSPITVTLTLLPAGTSLSPIGVVDTPTDNRTGVTGAIPFTGWALDDIEVTRVSICRAAFGAEVAPIDPNCGGAAEIFIGFAVFIDGARPDVAAAFPSYPFFTRAGWGFMVLTNMLPSQGNGTYTFRARAFDRDGHAFLLGTRTMTCANASATLPFGTLDTPLQGDTISGSSYINFGWALTPLPKTIPIDGSTIRVFVDGLDVGNADYNHARPDIQALFPGLNNTNGAIGFRILDTTQLANGLHTIQWTVTDNQGAIEGLGSRFFAVSNGSSAVTAAALPARAAIDLDRVPLDTTSLVGRRGWDLNAPYGVFAPSASGAVVVRSEEVSRVELQLGGGEYAGYLRTPTGLAPLPIGSRLDASTNTFTWAPTVGFIGRYDFVFVRSIHGRDVSRRAVRIVLYPKGRGSVGPQVVIDAPRANAPVDQPFMIGGWAADLDAPTGTGVTTIHAWAYPASGGAPIFLGATVYGGMRPDVAAVYGDQFTESGFGLIAQGLAAGDYDVALFAWSTETMAFVAPTVVRVSVQR
jgi:Tol biopolymer transport system component